MLIKRAVLDRIAAGEIDTLFRRQKRRTVKVGGTLRTAVGVLGIDAIDEVDPAAITDREARRAGARDAAEVRADLDAKAEGTVLRVRVRLLGDDPRLALRNDVDLDDAALDEIETRLGRLDGRSGHGPWTTRTLELISERPHVRAPDLAESVGLDTAVFKADVRKLKNLGLTISHSPGYELSPRGKVVLGRLHARD